MDITSIQVSKKSKEQWRTLKNHPSESFENMFNRILKYVYEDDSDLLTEQDLKDIEKSIQEFKEGKFVTNDELKNKYGL